MTLDESVESDVVVWSPRQQQWIDQAKALVAEAMTWEDQTKAMDYLHRQARRNVELSHGETEQWAACYRQIASIFQSALRVTGRRTR